MRKFVTLVAAAALPLTPAAAATYIYSPTVAVAGSVDEWGDLSIPLPGEPLTLQVGDTISGHISFDGPITLTDNGTSLLGEEWVQLNLLLPLDASIEPDSGTPPYGTPYAFALATLLLTGISGDYLGSTIPEPSSFNGELGALSAADLTETSFSFTGLDYSVTYQEGDATLFKFGSVNVPYLFGHPSVVAGVPEPATWAMMLFGFGGIGFAMRRRRRQEGVLPLA